MALEHRIESLKKQHARLDQLLRAEEAHPSAEDSVIRGLKSRKLALKDQIEQLLHEYGIRMAA